MKEAFLYSFFFIFFIFLTVTQVSAAAISFSPLSTQLFPYDEEVPITAKLTISASDGANYYLRGVFYKEGSSNYCGLTWNGTSFYQGPYTTNEGWKNFLKVTIKDNAWEGVLKAKIDSEDSGCKDSGTYLFKIQRFTESGSGSFDSQDTLTVTFTLPTPTPVPSPTAKPTPTSHPTPTNKVVSITKSTTNTSPQNNLHELTPTEVLESAVAQKTNPHFTRYNSTQAAVLSEATESADDASVAASQFPVRVLGSSTSLWPVIFSTIGGGMLILCAILAFRIYKRTN